MIDSNKYKASILKSSQSQSLKDQIAFTHYPKYIWIAKAYVKGVLVFDLIFDSTDIARGYFCIDFHLLDNAAKDLLKQVFIDRSYAFFEDGTPLRLGTKLFEIFKKALT